MPAHRISSGMKALRRQVARKADEGLEEGLDRLVGAHRHAQRQGQRGGDGKAAEHAPHRHADVVGEAHLGEQRRSRSCTIVSGSARKVLLTKPPKVTADHSATNSTKKLMPSTTRVPGATGVSGFTGYLMKRVSASLVRSGIWRMMPASSSRSAASLLNCGVLAGEELLVGGAVLPAQIGLALLEGFAALLDVGAHDLEALLRVGLDHLERVEVAVGQALRGLGVVGQELGRAAEGGVAHHQCCASCREEIGLHHVNLSVHA